MGRNESVLKISIIILVAATISLPLGRFFYPLVEAYFHRELLLSQISVTANAAVATVPSVIPIRITKPKIAPNKISFPSLNHSLNVAAATISNNKWQLFEDKVAWLSTSDEPGSGNTIIYGHNWKTLFGPLTRLKVGDRIVLQHNAKSLNYEVSEIRKILPTDVDAIISNNNQLTLYTCDGAFDQKRLVVIATLKP